MALLLSQAARGNGPMMHKKCCTLKSLSCKQDLQGSSSSSSSTVSPLHLLPPHTSTLHHVGLQGLNMLVLLLVLLLLLLVWMS